MTAPYLGLWLEEGHLPRGRSCDHPHLSSRTGRKSPPAAVSPTKMKMQERRPKMVGELLKLVSNNAVQVCGWSGDLRGFIHQGKPCKEHGDAFCAKISGQTQHTAKASGDQHSEGCREWLQSLLSSTTRETVLRVCRPPAHRP